MVGTPQEVEIISTQLMNKNHLRIVNLDNYVSPDVSEKPSRDYVTFGNKNQFFQHLIDRSRGSVTNGGIISSVSNLIYGKGLDSDRKAMHPDQWAQLLQLFKPNEIKRMIRDFEITGQFAIQVVWAGGHKKISSATHFPIETLAAEKVDESGEIKNYYYAKDWLRVRSMNDLTKFPVFQTSNSANEILVVAPYEPGMFYYSLPKWFSAIQWAELEEEIVNYHLNGVQNSFAPSMFISMNNGIPQSEDEADEIVQRMMDRYQGSSEAGRVIVSFNTDKEHESTITPVALSDLPEQYQFLSEESAFKILTAHSITSPLLVGIPPKGTGFSSNAEELKVGSILLETNVINPKRITIIEAFEQISVVNNITIPYHFESLNPFAEEENADIEADMETQLSAEDLDAILEKYAVEAPEGYDLFEGDLSEVELSVIQKSEQDTKLWKIRYEYVIGTSKSHAGKESRAFCSKMVSLAKSGRLFRKEDIDKMSAQGVNGEFAHSGGKYDIFLYGGGVNCYHRWERRIFKKRRDEDGEPLGGNAMANTFPVNVKEAQRQGAKLPKNNPDVAIAEIDKENNGRVV